jgi:cytochrome c oxidase assembly protein subunit 11
MTTLAEKNRKVMGAMLSVVATMVLVSFLSVPLYRLTCKVTGWGGTTRVGEAPAAHGVIAHPVTIHFNTDTARDLPWVFAPEQAPVSVNAGENKLVSFSAENKSDTMVTGTAVYNVTPFQAGKYFIKTQCFCFSKQILQPHQKVHMPVAFYVDPKIADDPDLKDLKAITLSYTFYRTESGALEQATQKFYDDHSDKQAKVN